jgi:hypothetical protein
MMQLDKAEVQQLRQQRECCGIHVEKRMQKFPGIFFVD